MPERILPSERDGVSALRHRLRPVADALCVCGVPARFRRRIPGGTLLLLIVSTAGCAYDPGRFHVPEIWPRHPELERRAAEYHDPFPDDAIGPSADARPRGFHRQRSETRRAAELRSVHFLDGADRLPSTGGRPGRRFSQVVQP